MGIEVARGGRGQRLAYLRAVHLGVGELAEGFAVGEVALDRLVRHREPGLADLDLDDRIVEVGGRNCPELPDERVGGQVPRAVDAAPPVVISRGSYRCSGDT